MDRATRANARKAEKVKMTMGYRERTVPAPPDRGIIDAYFKKRWESFGNIWKIVRNAFGETLA